MVRSPKEHCFTCAYSESMRGVDMSMLEWPSSNPSPSSRSPSPLPSRIIGRGLAAMLLLLLMGVMADECVDAEVAREGVLYPTRDGGVRMGDPGLCVKDEADAVWSSGRRTGEGGYSPAGVVAGTGGYTKLSGPAVMGDTELHDSVHDAVS